MSMSPMEVAGKPVEDGNPINSLKSPTFDSNSYGETVVSIKALFASVFSVGEPPQSPSDSPLKLLQQLQDELHSKNMLFSEHQLQLGKVIGEGKFSMCNSYTSN